MIKIKVIEFEILESRFAAYIHLGQDGLECSVDIDFRTVPKVIDGDNREFHISSHSLDICLPSLELLPGKHFDISQPVDGEPQMGIYSYAHDPIKQAELRFGQWTESGIEFVLKGVVDICEEPPLDGDLELLVDCILPFDGVVVDEPDIEKAVSKLEIYFKPQHFLTPERDDIGRQVFRLNGIPG